MKKIIYFLTFLLVLIPINTKALAGIENYRIDITVLENGDVNIIEAFKMNGEYNGFERIINFKSNFSSYYGDTLSSTNDGTIYNGKGLILNEIRGIEFSDKELNLIKENGDLFKKVNNASKGDYGVYIPNKNSNGENYLIYNNSKMNKDFYLDYTLQNIAILHNDIGELGLNLFTEMKESIHNLEVYIHVPNNKTLFRIWAHGPLNGETKIIDMTTAKLTIQDLDANTAIDFRIAFDKNILTTKKISNVSVLDKIIDIETKLANDANIDRDNKYKKLKDYAYTLVETAIKTEKRSDYNLAFDTVNKLKEDDQLKVDLKNKLNTLLPKIEKREQNIKIINTVIISSWIIGLFILIFHTYKKYDKEYKSDFKNNYYRDFPATYGPATLGYLLRKKVNNDDLSASILNLINNKVIDFKPTDDKDYLFTKLDANIALKEADERLLKFLFNDEPQIKLSDFKKKAKNDYSSFISLYSNWINRVTIDAEAENFYEVFNGIKMIGSMYAILGIILGFVYISIFHYFSSIIMIILGIIGLIYFITFIKRTKKGNDDYVKWNALKRFMTDFGNMDDKQLPEITLWEKYLVYAVSLGCAEKLAKSMKIKIETMNSTGDILFDIYYYNNIINFNRVLNVSINSAISSAYSAKSVAEASSTSSSGGGFGGGFSGGGGSFGGGGGGGRF